MNRAMEQREGDLSVDRCVESFERAWAIHGNADPTDFLPPLSHPNHFAILGELLRVDMEYRFERGIPEPLEFYRQRYSALFSDSSRISGVVYEDFRLRRLAGQNPLPSDYRRHFGVSITDWPVVDGEGDDSIAGPSLASESSAQGRRARAETSGRSQSAPSTARLEKGPGRDGQSVAPVVDDAGASMPGPGARFLGFQLEAELGRGAFGRVFLARQGDLASRPVALKVSAEIQGESLTLARLQHTNVMPIYSVHRGGAFHAVCMPYLGATTLADLLSHLKTRTPDQYRAADLSATIEKNRARLARFIGSGESIAKKSGKIGFIETVTDLAHRLAEGLAHAHERGIHHRDLKPANILLADDGEPLLLDFNLAADTQTRSRAAAALIGGTLPYMAPEQLAAFQGPPINGPPTKVTAAADVYSFGLILFEWLTGQFPFPIRSGSLDTLLPVLIADKLDPLPDPRSFNKAVSPALAAIIRKCLEPDPSRRYADARPLQEDLHRQVHHLPLKHLREPSIPERLRKWSRRHPRLTSASTIGILGLTLVVVLIGLLFMRQRQIETLAAAESLHRLESERVEAEVLLGARDATPGQRREGELLVDAVLARYGSSGANGLLVGLADGWQNQRLLVRLEQADRIKCLEDLGEILFLAARSAFWNQQMERARELAGQSALAYGSLPPRALCLLRAEIFRSEHDENQAKEWDALGEKSVPTTYRHRLLLAVDRLDRGQFGEALPFVLDASRKRPEDPGILVLLGNGYVSLGLTEQASQCYEAAMALRPDLLWLSFQRGVLELERGNHRLASTQFDRVLESYPHDPNALINRSLARLGLNDCQGAITDLDEALKQAEAPTRAYFIRSRAKAQCQDLAGAKKDLALGLQAKPSDTASWIARGVARLPQNPAEALTDFDRALELDPHSYDALQNKGAVLGDYLAKPEAGIRVFDRLIALHPGRVRPRDGRGILLARQGLREQAHRDGEAALKLDADAETAYRVAGIYAMTSKKEPKDRVKALALLASAISRDPKWLKTVPEDEDLEPIRKTKEFQALIKALEPLQPNPSN